MLIPDHDRPVSFTLDNSSPAVRVEPITLAMTKLQTRFTSTTEDDLFADFIGTARMLFEQAGRQCVNAVWEYSLDGSPRSPIIELPRPPLISVDSIKYDDADGVEQTLDPSLYTVTPSLLDATDQSIMDPYCTPGKVQLIGTSAQWPITTGEPTCLRIRRTCGYGTTADAMPPAIRSILYLLVTHLHRNRAEVAEMRWVEILPLGAKQMMQAFAQSALVVRRPEYLYLPANYYLLNPRLPSWP